MIYIGVDPGKAGGLACLSASGKPLDARAMPSTEMDLWTWFDRHRVDAKATLELVHASPQMGTVSAFTFGRGYGRLEMALTSALIPWGVVTPQTWQKVMGCMSGGDKNVTKRRAQQLFPLLTITHAIADALLIAEFCRRVHKDR